MAPIGREAGSGYLARDRPGTLDAHHLHHHYHGPRPDCARPSLCYISPWRVRSPLPAGAPRQSCQPCTMTSRRPTSSHTPTDNTQQPDMSENFRNFSSLPPEIRSMIWEYSLPDPRIYEVLDAPNAKQKTPAQDGLMFANVHPEPPPPLAAVCRESRYFVLRHYKPLRLGRTTKFVDLSRDILLLEPYLLVKRLHRTLHFMGQIRSCATTSTASPWAPRTASTPASATPS